MNSTHTPHIGIIGAGYAGLSAALTLADAGIKVSIFEKRKIAGGRARAIKNPFTSSVYPTFLDNGQHALTGGHVYTLQLIKRFHAIPPLFHLPSQLVFPNEFECARVNLPAPFHWGVGFLKSPHCRFKDYVSLFKLGISAFRNPFNDQATLQNVLDTINVSSHIQKFVIEPVCLAALNTIPAHGSAIQFFNVFKDLFFTTQDASDTYLPTTDLTNLLPQQIIDHLLAQDQHVHLQTTISNIQKVGNSYCLTAQHATGEKQYDFNGIICAVSPFQLPDLTSSLPELVPTTQEISSWVGDTIDTIYLRYAEEITLPSPMIGLSGNFGQWAFDLGQVKDMSRMISVVHSFSNGITKVDRPQYLTDLLNHFKKIGLQSLTNPTSFLWTTEKMATWRSAPGLKRPSNRTPLDRMMLAGDYTIEHLPATLEAATLSGKYAAEEMIQMLA